MTKPLSPAEKVAQEINRALTSGTSLVNNEKIKSTLHEIQNLDQGFQEKGGIFFHTGSDAFETAKRFTEIHVNQYRETGRPSLPALAVHHAETLGIDKNSPEYKAMILVAVRAEMKVASLPDYHNQHHFTDVAAMTANLLAKNDEMAKTGAAPALSKQEIALTFVAAIGHDLDHEGKGNPPDNPLLNEQKSFELMAPLLEEAGLSQGDISKVHTILMTTSPNGPHSILKAVAQAQREGNTVDFSSIKGADKFPDLKGLLSNPKLTQMAAIVSDSDLYASSGAGEEASVMMSGKLSNETQMDFRGEEKRKGFFDFIVGKEGFASHAGREVANESYKALYKETEKRIATKPKPPAR
jgi:hypothetical protein